MINRLTTWHFLWPGIESMGQYAECTFLRGSRGTHAECRHAGSCPRRIQSWAGGAHLQSHVRLDEVVAGEQASRKAFPLLLLHEELEQLLRNLCIPRLRSGLHRILHDMTCCLSNAGPPQKEDQPSLPLPAFSHPRGAKLLGNHEALPGQSQAWSRTFEEFFFKARAHSLRWT